MLVEAADFSVRILKGQIFYVGFPYQNKQIPPSPQQKQIKTRVTRRTKNQTPPPPGPATHSVPAGLFIYLFLDGWFQSLACPHPGYSARWQGKDERLANEKTLLPLFPGTADAQHPYFLFLKQQREYSTDLLGCVAVWWDNPLAPAHPSVSHS